MTEDNKQVIEWSVNDKAIAKVAEGFKDVDAYENLDEAKAAKKFLTKMRTKLSEAHKETKAEALAFGRKVDGEKNRLLALIHEIEDPISAQLTEIKQAEERKEQERVDAIMAEIEKIQAFALDRHSLTLDELNERRSTLGVFEITEEVFQEHLDSAKLSRDEADLKLRLAIDAEKTRIEEERRAKELEEENRILREQREEYERDKRELEERLAAEQAERDRIAKEGADAKAKVEREAREVAEAEAKRLRDEQEARERAEAEEKAAEEAKARAKEQAPDREKLLAYADDVDSLLKVKPVLKTDRANEILLNAAAMLIEVAHDIRTSTEEMK